MPACPECGQENREGARFCDSCGAALAAVAPAREMRKVVTVLFADVAGFTATGEQLDPEALRRVQARYFEDARTALERHGATVEKFIGDAVMAVFGIPRVHEDDALRAVRAAVDLREAVAPLEVRIGVNTGEVVAGQGEALVTGDTVNVAARLEQAAEPGEILVGERTLLLCRDAVEVQTISPLELKGKGEAVPAHRLLRVLEGVPAVERRLDSPLVGREHELAVLRQAFGRAVSERSCHLFTLLGPAGVGKSRLVAELVSGIAPEATVWTGRCLSYGEGITYWPLVQIFREAAGDADLERALAQPTPEETAWTVRMFLEGRARERPLVLVLDDLHWAEPTFLDLVEHVADLSRDAPILLVCLARPELLDVRPAWGGGKLNATTVLLEPLTGAESEQLVSNLAGRLPLDENVRTRIVETSEGNPLFVEEMLAMAAEEDGGDLEVPPTIQALLTARLDRLDAHERQVVERGSIEGRVFHRGAVFELAPEQLRPDVTAHLISLVRKELIRPDEAELLGEDAFRFRHLLMRDAAYQGLPKEERALMHQHFARWLEPRGGEEYEEIVGYHLEQAYRYRLELGPIDDLARALARRAAERLAAAGRRAHARSDMPAAAGLLGRAAALLEPGDAERAAVLPELGSALASIGDLGRADEVLAEALEAATSLEDVGLEARATAERFELLLLLDPEGRTEQAWADAERLIAALDGSGDDRSLAKAWWLEALADLMAGRYADMDRAATKSLEHAVRARDFQGQSAAAFRVAVATVAGPTPVREAIARCKELRARIDLPAAGAGIDVTLPIAYGMSGQVEEARRMALRGRALYRELGMEVLWAAASMHQAWVERFGGDPALAEPVLREGCDVLDRLGERSYLSTGSAVLAQILYDLAQYEESEAQTHVSEEAAAQEDLISQVIWRAVRAKLFARRGDLVEAERLARDAVALAETGDALAWTGEALLDLAEVLVRAGKDDEARPCVAEALELFERKGVVRLAERARARLAELEATT